MGHPLSKDSRSPELSVKELFSVGFLEGFSITNQSDQVSNI